MTIVAICVGSKEGEPVTTIAAATVVAGAGIIGDRYFSSHQRHPGQNVTLIEAEEIEAFNARTGARLSLTDPRRNLITRAIRLAPLVGKEFLVGSVRLRGVELCEPCATLASYIAPHGMSKAEFIRQFENRCGLRADVVTSGRISVGDALAVS